MQCEGGAKVANSGETETYAGYVRGDEYAYLYSAESKWIRKMKRWAEEFPDQVKVVIDNADGMEINMPTSWFKISPKRERNLSDEQRAAMSARMKKS